MTLSELTVGKSGVIAHLGGETAETQHLLDMGLTPGTRVTLIGTALLGDPLIIKVRGNRLSIRRRLAKEISMSGGEDA